VEAVDTVAQVARVGRVEAQAISSSSLESQDEKEARCKIRRDKHRAKFAALMPEEKAARDKTRRDKRTGALCVQAVTHLMFALLFPQCEALLVQQKWEIDKFLDAVQAASHLAADQGKVMAIQIQFVQPDCRAIHTECRSGPWPKKLSDFGSDCGLLEVCHVTFTYLHSVSAGHAHLLETHAQRKMIQLTSYDPDGAI